MKRMFTFSSLLARSLPALFIFLFTGALSLHTMEAAAQNSASADAAAAISACSYDTSIAVYDDYRGLLDFTDPFRGASQASVTVIEFFDPNCPHCKALHPVMQRVIEEHGDVAQFVLEPFPVFRYSFPQILALRVAAQENKFFEMLNEQFARQQAGSGLTLDQLKDIAREIGMDAEEMETQMRSENLQQQVIEDYQMIASEAGISSVPTVMINGRIVAAQSRTPRCLSMLIEEAASQSEE